MNESPDFGGLEPLDAGTGDDTEPGTEIDVIVYDAEFIDDGTSTDDIIDGEAVDPGMELYDGWLVEQDATVTVEDVSDLPREPQLGGEFEQPTPRVTSDSGPASSGAGGGLGGGQLLKRCPRCGRRHAGSCRQARRGGGSGGGGSGGSGGAKYHFSLLGGLHLLSGNRADASVLRAGPIASPSVTGIATGGRRPNASGARRPLRD